MQKTAGVVSSGYSDKTADYISCYILDRMIEQDPHVKYAMEVLIKDNTVVLGGEITGNVNLDKAEDYVVQALSEIGYDDQYSRIWGEYAINSTKPSLINLIGCQSADINQGAYRGIFLVTAAVLFVWHTRIFVAYLRFHQI